MKDENQRVSEEWIRIPVQRGMMAIAGVLDICEVHGGRVMGGYARYACSPHSRPTLPSDIDIFPVGRGDTRLTYGALYRAMTEAGFSIQHESQLSTSFSHPSGTGFGHMPMCQLIKPETGALIGGADTVASVLAGFDFSVTRVALETDRRSALASPLFLQDEIERRLRIVNIVCPISTLQRTIRYEKRGYSADRTELVKLMLDWELRPTAYKAKAVKAAAGGTPAVGTTDWRLPLASPLRPTRPVSSGWDSGRDHRGVDYDAAQGTPVYSPTTGVVDHVRNSIDSQTCDASFGNYVKIKVNAFSIYLAHLSQGTRVRPGQHVHPGTLLGFVGNSGHTMSRSSGYQCKKGGGFHLHLEVRKNGEAIDPLGSPHVLWT